MQRSETLFTSGSGDHDGGLRGFWRRWSDDEYRLGYLMVMPALLLLVVMVAYPFVMSIWLGFTDTRIAQAATGNFIGFENYVDLINRSVFADKVINNTILYTVGAVPLKLALGMILALLLNRKFPLRNVIRGLILLPWVVPTSLSMIIFLWLFEPTFSVLNVLLERGGFDPINWLGTPSTALFSVMMVNVWRGTPFFGVILLAALQGVPQDQIEAARIDGANTLQRFWHITIPTIM
ncbi:MAG: sugar ABC transporter permease, partial [Chloroflexota bacterium]